MGNPCHSRNVVSKNKPWHINVGRKEMKTLVISLIASILLIKCSTAEEKHSKNVNLKAWSDRDLKAIQNISLHAIMGLTLAERNEVALAAAKSLSIKEYIGVIGKNSIFKHFTKPPAQDSPEEAECRRQLGINMSAAELLRHLSEMKMIDDPAVLPYLIDALDHPARSFVGQRCFYALTYLTRQRTGDIYWARLVDDPEKHAAIRKWWIDWFDKNKESHPIFDRNLEEKARSEVLRLSGIIEKELKPNFQELALFQSPPTLPLRWQRPLFYIEYNPGNWSLAIDTFKGIDRKRLPWILITCRFDSQGQMDTWEQEERVQPPENLKKNITRCYFGRIAGSSLLIEVLAASPDESMIKQIQAVLKIDKDTQQPPAGDHLKAPSNPIVTEVEYRYVSATDPARGAPHFRAVAVVSSDHILSETNEIAIIRDALSKWSHSSPRSMENASAAVQSIVAKTKELKGVSVTHVSFEDFSPFAMINKNRLVEDRSVVTFRVNNNALIAGESFALYLDKSDTYFVVHTVYGSGRPILSSATYQVTTVKRGERTDYQFAIPQNENQKLTFTIVELKSKYTLSLFDREINTVITKKSHKKTPEGIAEELGKSSE